MAELTGTWRVVELDGRAIEAGGAPWLTFDGDGQVYGSGGVNRVRGTWALDGTVLTLGPLASTLMAGPQEAMDREHALLTLLAQPLSVDGDVDRVLAGADGRTARLAADPPVSFVL